MSRPLAPFVPAPPLTRTKSEPMVVMTTRVPAQLRRRLWIHFCDDVQKMKYRSMSHIVETALQEFLDRHGAK